MKPYVAGYKWSRIDSRMLVERSLSNRGDNFNHTPLNLVACSFLVRYERRILTELLLRHGADIQASDIFGNVVERDGGYAGVYGWLLRGGE